MMWMQGIQTDGNDPYYYTNVHYLPNGGSSDYDNWHIYYCGVVGNYYVWSMIDSVTGYGGPTGYNSADPPYQAAEYEAGDLANTITSIVGYSKTPSVYSTLLSPSPLTGKDLQTQVYDLMSYPITPVGQHKCGRAEFSQSPGRVGHSMG